MEGQEARTSESLPLTAWWDFLRARGGVTPSGWASAFFGLYGEARLRPNGVPFSGLRDMKRYLAVKKSRKRSGLVTYSYLFIYSAFSAVIKRVCKVLT